MAKLRGDRNAALDYAEWAENERDASSRRAEALTETLREKAEAAQKHEYRATQAEAELKLARREHEASLQKLRDSP